MRSPSCSRPIRRVAELESLGGTASHVMKTPIAICCGALLACSALSMTNESPWLPYIGGAFNGRSFNTNPPTAEEVYVAGYQDGYSLGYHGAWCGIRPFASIFPEAYWRGEGRGRRDGASDAEVDCSQRARVDAERERTHKQPWHPPLLPDSGDSDLQLDLLHFRFTEE